MIASIAFKLHIIELAMHICIITYLTQILITTLTKPIFFYPKIIHIHFQSRICIIFPLQRLHIPRLHILLNYGKQGIIGTRTCIPIFLFCQERPIRNFGLFGSIPNTTICKRNGRFRKQFRELGFSSLALHQNRYSKQHGTIFVFKQIQVFAISNIIRNSKRF